MGYHIYFCLLVALPILAEAQGGGPSYCGVPLKDRRVINGVDAEPFQFPWQVPLFISSPAYYGDGEGDFVCSGTIISSRTILTAGHCIPPPEYAQYLFLKIGLREGDVDYDAGYKIFVEEAIIHPYYDEMEITYDFGVLNLAEELVFSEGLQPICLPSPFKEYEEEQATLSGWGLTEEGMLSESLQQLNLTVMSNMDCKAELAKYYEKNYGEYCPWCNQIYAVNLCANATDASGCNGDSGGPLVYLNKDTEPQFYTQIGVVSWGTPRCPVGGPNVYSKIQDQLYWIFTQMRGTTLPAPGARDA